MVIETRAVGPFFKNGFLLACERTAEAVVIDPGDEVDDLLAIVAERRLSVRYVLLTHAHVDHVTGVAACRRAVPLARSSCTATTSSSTTVPCRWG